MEPTSDLFGMVSAPTMTKEEVRWILVTNQRNLFYMLASGLIMPAKGFGKKYYRDTLENFPGQIPLFANRIPQSAIDYSVGERSHLLPCLVTLDISDLSGRVITIGSDKIAHEINFPGELPDTCQVILITAPLPISLIKSISFRSREEKSSCEADAKDFGNVPLSDFKRLVAARDFTDTIDLPWPLPRPTIPTIEVGLGIPFAAGGIMAMLFHLANLGELGTKTCQLSFDADENIAATINDPLIAPLGRWMKVGCVRETADMSSTLFWSIVEKVAMSRFSDEPVSARDIVLSHLEAEGDHLGGRINQALAKLARDLRTIATFPDSTITELFERHPKTFSRAMILFFLHNKCVDLLECKHPLLTEANYIAGAILFAAREGWLGLPLTLRHCSVLQPAISHRMAAMAQRLANTGLDLGATPTRPVPMRELFLAGQKGWNPAQKEASLALAREGKWECIQTRISLGKGKYHLVVDGGGAHLLLSGDAKAVSTEIDPEQFFAALAANPIPPKLDSKIRNLLSA